MFLPLAQRLQVDGPEPFGHLTIQPFTRLAHLRNRGLARGSELVTVDAHVRFRDNQADAHDRDDQRDDGDDDDQPLRHAGHAAGMRTAIIPTRAVIQRPWRGKGSIPGPLHPVPRIHHRHSGP